MTDRRQQPRLLSHSEISTALTCQARWDFAYGGHLAGTALEPRETALILDGGRAWGAAMATWHAGGGSRSALWSAHQAITDSLDAGEAEMRERGHEPDAFMRHQLEWQLMSDLDHYASTATPLDNLTRVEAEVQVAAPSRSGRQSSNRYKFLCHLDGYTVQMEDGTQWVVEFKWRGSLQNVRLIARSRQFRWYAWALGREQGGYYPAGILVDERLQASPQPARLVNAKRKGEGINGRTPSHAVDQLTTPESYVELCIEYGVDPNPDTYAAIKSRVWQQRVPVLFRNNELREAGREIASGGLLVKMLDSGQLYPVRNVQAGLCNRCRFERICDNPQDEYVIDLAYVRKPAKRNREPMEAGHHA